MSDESSATHPANHNSSSAHCPPPPAPSSLFSWLFAVLPLLGWWLYGLFDMDEGFYGAVTAEMNRRGEWITPYYNGHPWFEKPILLYWFAKPSMMALGDWVGPRLPSIIATICTYWLVVWFARRHWGDAAAQRCLVIVSSSILVVGIGRMMMTDALLEVCLAGAFIFFWESLVGDRRWRLLAAFFLGLAVLAKGPVGIFLFVPVGAWTWWRERELREAFRGWWLAGIAILAATIATWYLPAYLANGQEFVQKFLIEQNLNRFTGGDPAHNTPIWTDPIYYPLILLLGMAPWSFSIWKIALGPRTSECASPGDDQRSLREIAHSEVRGPRGGLDRYLATWIIVPLIFFSISKAKLPHYILPCCVPMALLIGSRASPGWSRLKSAAPGVIVCILVNAGFWFYYSLFHREVHDLAFYVRDHIKPGEDVAAYQMPRRQHDLGTGKPKIQETSHPSLVMYLNRTISEPDGLAGLLKDRNPQWVITRWNRIQPSDVQSISASGRELRPVDTPEKQDLYRLFYLTRGR